MIQSLESSNIFANCKKEAQEKNIFNEFYSSLKSNNKKNKNSYNLYGSSDYSSN